MNQYLERSVIWTMPEGILGYRVFAGRADATQVVVLAAYSQGRVVFISGEPGPTFDVVTEVHLGKYDNSVVYTGIKDEKHFVVLNGNASAAYDWVGKLHLSRDGKSVAYPAMREIRDKQEYRMVVNGNFGPAFDLIGETVWHPFELLVAYVGGSGRSEQVVLGDRLLPKYERVLGLQFSPDGRLFYWGLKDGNWWLCTENGSFEVSEGDNLPTCGALLFGADDKLGFWRCKQKKWFVHYGNQIFGPWPGVQEIIGSPVLSDDLQNVIYVAEENDRVRVIKNDQRGPEFDAVGRPVMQSNLLVYKARVGKEEFLIVNESRSKAYLVLWPEEGEYATYLEDLPVISSKGDKIAFLAASGTGKTVVVNGIEHPSYKRINGQPRFSRMTDKLVYGAQNGGQQFVLIDSETLGPFDEVFSAQRPSGLIVWQWCPDFSEDGKQLRFFCVESRSIFRCAVSL